MLSKLFGVDGKQTLDTASVQQQFAELAKQARMPAAQVAEGFLNIAVENMASAIKKSPVQRGYDVSDYTLCCFGGASGQRTCLVAERLRH